MATSFAPARPIVDDTDAAPVTGPAASAAPAVAEPVARAEDDATVERDYFRTVALAWLAGIPIVAVLVAALGLAVGGRYDTGALLAMGAMVGFWIGPLVGVAGIGIWASRHPH